MKKCLPAIFCLITLIAHGQTIRNSTLGYPQQVEDQSTIRKGENIDEKIKKNFFVKAVVSKTSCFVGEPVMATYTAYSRLNASLTVMKRPAFTGFSVLEMVDGYGSEPEVEMVNGNAFNTHLIRKAQLFPLQEGKFLLESAEVDGRLFLRNRDTVKYLTVKTPEILINVKALPLKNQPDSFSGAVGTFSAELQMKDRELYQYDPAIARLVIMGTGNFPLITDPGISWPKELEVSAPQVTEDVNRYIYPLSGAKVFEYHLETGRPGEYTIPPIQFSYFDPAEDRYKTTQTGAVTFMVKKGKRKVNLAEKIIRRPEDIPLQYYYFGVIGLAVLGWVVYQVVRSRKKK